MNGYNIGGGIAIVVGLIIFAIAMYYFWAVDTNATQDMQNQTRNLSIAGIVIGIILVIIGAAVLYMGHRKRMMYIVQTN